VREWVVVSAVIPLELFMFLVRLLRMVSISPEGHRPPLRRLHELNPNPRKPILLCTRPVLIIGCPAWMHVRDVDGQGRWRYSTSFQSVYAPRPNSRSHQYLSRPYHNRCDLRHQRHLPHPHNPLPRHQCQSLLLPARGRNGFRCRQSTIYNKLLICPWMARLGKLLVIVAMLHTRTRSR